MSFHPEVTVTVVAAMGVTDTEEVPGRFTPALFESVLASGDTVAGPGVYDTETHRLAQFLSSPIVGILGIPDEEGMHAAAMAVATWNTRAAMGVPASEPTEDWDSFAWAAAVISDHPVTDDEHEVED